jgi:hypothetical protein
MGRKLRVRQVLVAFLEPQFQQRLADCAAGILKDVMQISGGDSYRHRDALGRKLGRAGILRNSFRNICTQSQVAQKNSHDAAGDNARHRPATMTCVSPSVSVARPLHRQSRQANS